MTDKKISQLTNILGSQVDDANDELAIVDASSNETKAITRAELMSSVSTMSIDNDFAVDTDTLYVDSSNNRVGVGTSSPAGALDILAGTTGNDVKFIFEEVSSNQSQISFFEGSNTIFGLRYDGSGANPSNQLKVVSGTTAGTLDTDVMTFTQSGNVGIGTSSPNNALHVFSGADGEVAEFTGAVKGRGFHVSTTASPDGSGHSILNAKSGGSAGILSFQTDSSEAMRIDSNGNVGIGTSSPAYDLDVKGAGFARASFTRTDGQTSLIRFEGNDTTTAPLIGAFTDAFYVNTGGSEAMRIDSGGNVGIGTSSPVSKLDVEYGSGNTYPASSVVGPIFSDKTASENFGLNIFSDNASNASINFGDEQQASAGRIVYDHNGNANTMSFYTSAAERARIDSSGNVLVGTTDSFPGNSGEIGISLRPGIGSVIATDNDEALFLCRNTSDGDIVDFRKDGNTVGSISVTSSTTSYNTSSDERLKENIADAQPASDLIDGIQVREFDWKADGEHQRYGMVAQELETVAPEAVTKGDTDEEMWSVDYSKLVPMLVKEIQDLRKRVADLET
jgi:hypothetical protein